MSNAFSELCTITCLVLCVKNTCMYSKYLFQQISKFLEESMDAFYGIRTLKSIDYSKNN